VEKRTNDREEMKGNHNILTTIRLSCGPSRCWSSARREGNFEDWGRVKSPVMGWNEDYPDPKIPNQKEVRPASPERKYWPLVENKKKKPKDEHNTEWVGILPSKGKERREKPSFFTPCR